MKYRNKALYNTSVARSLVAEKFKKVADRKFDTVTYIDLSSRLLIDFFFMNKTNIYVDNANTVNIDGAKNKNRYNHHED